MSFIGIKLEGDTEFLETSPDTNISIKLESPIVGTSDKLSPGSFSMPFNLPGGDISPKNNAKLKNPDVIENSEAYQLQRASLFLAGVPFKTGNLKSNSFDTKRISAYFTFGLNTLSADFKTKKMRDVVTEEKVIQSSDIGKVLYIKKSGTEDITVDVCGISFTADSTASLSAAINLYFADNSVADRLAWLPYSQLVFSGTTPSGLITATYLELKLARLVNIGGFDVMQYNTDISAKLYFKVPDEFVSKFQVESFDSDAYYAAYETFITAAHAASQLRFPVRYNANLHASETVKDGEVINGVDIYGLIVNDPNWGLANSAPMMIKNFNSVQPFLRMKWVLDQIADEFGFEYEGDFYEWTELDTMLIDNTQTLDTLMDYIGSSKFAFWRTSFNISELVPDISVVDFFKAIQSRYNLAIYQNETNGKIRMQFREPIAKSLAYHDITPISSPVEMIQDDRSTGFTFKVPKESSDAFSVEETVVVGEPDRTIEIKCGRLHQTNVENFSGADVAGPYVSQKNGEKFGLRVFHYKGMVDNGSFEYPASDIHGVNYEQLADYITTSGIYTTHWKYWLHYEMRRVMIKIKINLPLRQLRGFDWELKRRFNRNNFLVKSMDLRVSNKGLQIVNAELYTMR
jgi:hypothetical protein